MAKVLITGATGMVGGLVLRKCLKSKKVDKIVSFVRKPSFVISNKLEEVVVSDFKDYSGYEKYFEDIDIVYFCIGVYTGAVPDDKFKEITVDYTIAFANEVKKYSPNAKFCFLSGAGADRKEKSRIAFAKYKGMAENYLLKELQNVYTFRPGYIYPVEKRKEPNLGYKIFRFLYPLFRLLGKNASIKSTQLASAMFKVGLKGVQIKILENKDIIELVTK